MIAFRKKTKATFGCAGFTFLRLSNGLRGRERRGFHAVGG